MDGSFRHKGWHSRGYLPHLDAPGEIQGLTFRLADALPSDLVHRWKRELENHEPEDATRKQKLQRLVARYEDAGHGSCVLAKPECASIMADTLRHFDGEKYHLLEWCVMPNHVHTLIRCVYGAQLGVIVRSWKTFSARGINQVMGWEGPLWAKDYFDRYIRDHDHLLNARAYIRNNPVKAGLCQRPEDWAWSSAGCGREGC